MKLVVTIFQTKRVVLPYFNIRYTLPAMREAFPGDLVIYLIQHRGGSHLLNSTKCYFETKDMPDECFERVKQWTQEGKYEGATIKSHTEHLGRYPSLPSMRKGIELALKEQADLHLWLEDDAIIYDLDCKNWSLPNGSIGVFTIFESEYSSFFKSAWLITTKGYDERAYPFFSESKNWNCRATHNEKEQVTQRLEGALYHLAEDGFVNFKREGKAARMHLGNNTDEVVEIVKKVAPEELPLLAIDFPEAWKKFNA